MRVLVIQAESRRMNPLLDEGMIAAEVESDAEAASSEWLGLFRASTVQYLPDADIDRAIVEGRRSLPYVEGRPYQAFCDPSGGRHDAMTLGIAHQTEERRCVLDVLLIQAPPFDPATVVAQFAGVLKGYKLKRVLGDRYGAEWVQSAFAKEGVQYEASELDKSAIYIETLPLFTQGRVELLDVPPLITQLRLLERRPRSGGRGDLVDHPPRAADDAANAAVGALLLASKFGVAGTKVQAIQHRPPQWDPRDPSTWGRGALQASKVHTPTAAEVAKALQAQIEVMELELMSIRARVVKGECNPRAIDRQSRRIEGMRRRLAELLEAEAA